VKGAAGPDDSDRVADRTIVQAFLAASRDGDLPGLLAVLDPEVVFRADQAAVRLGADPELRGAAAVAAAFQGRARLAEPVLIDGELGIRVAPGGRLLLLLRPIIVGGRIVEVEAVAEKARLDALTLGELPA